jgi:hypothetical protein
LVHDGLGGTAYEDPTETVSFTELTDLGEGRLPALLKELLSEDEVKDLEQAKFTFVPEGQYTRYLRFTMKTKPGHRHPDLQYDPKLPDCPPDLDPTKQTTSCVSIVQAPQPSDWRDLCHPEDPDRPKSCRSGEQRFVGKLLYAKFYVANLLNKKEGVLAVSMRRPPADGPRAQVEGARPGASAASVAS